MNVLLFYLSSNHFYLKPSFFFFSLQRFEFSPGSAPCFPPSHHFFLFPITFLQFYFLPALSWSPDGLTLINVTSHQAQPQLWVDRWKSKAKREDTAFSVSLSLIFQPINVNIKQHLKVLWCRRGQDDIVIKLPSSSLASLMLTSFCLQ